MTTTHRIPVSQHLWDNFRAASQTYARTLLDHERMLSLYEHEKPENQASQDGRLALMIRRVDAKKAAYAAMMTAVMKLAKAEAEHVMGRK